MSVPDYFLWLDIETTGLDETYDKILEVAWVITDQSLRAVSPPVSLVVKPSEEDWAVVGAADDFVQNMHTTNGLFAELDYASWTLDDVWRLLHDELSMLRNANPDAEIRLSGRSVHFDEKFLLANHFSGIFREFISHRHHDLSSIKTFLDMRGIDYDDIQGQNHRALDDVLADIEFARHLQTVSV